LGWYVTARVIPIMAYVCIKFEDHSFIHSKDTKEEAKVKNKGGWRSLQVFSNVTI